MGAGETGEEALEDNRVAARVPGGQLADTFSNMSPLLCSRCCLKSGQGAQGIASGMGRNSGRSLALLFIRKPP